MAYLMQLHGIKELSVLGTLGTNRTWSIANLAGTDQERAELQASVGMLLGPLQLTITGDSEQLTIPVEFVSKEFVGNHEYLLAHQVQASITVLVLAYEVTKGEPYMTHSPHWEFLRHCRNAAAHNGRFSFVNGEPRRPAVWRGIQLEPALDRQPLMRLPDGTGLLNIGDPIALLWEIEQVIPEAQNAA